MISLLSLVQFGLLQEIIAVSPFPLHKTHISPDRILSMTFRDFKARELISIFASLIAALAGCLMQMPKQISISWRYHGNLVFMLNGRFNFFVRIYLYSAWLNTLSAQVACLLCLMSKSWILLFLPCVCSISDFSNNWARVETLTEYCSWLPA